MEHIGFGAALIFVYIAGLFTKSLFPSYFNEKGKNIATKEDIKEITEKVEGVKADFSKELEAVKWNYTLEKTQRDQEIAYANTLFEKRLTIYPELYCLLSDYVKKIEEGEANAENLPAFKISVDKWNSKNALYFSAPTIAISGGLRKLLRLLINNDMVNNYTPEDWQKIRKILGDFENSLKAEVGIYTIKPVSTDKWNQQARNFVKELTEKTELMINRTAGEVKRLETIDIDLTKPVTISKGLLDVAHTDEEKV